MESAFIKVDGSPENQPEMPEKTIGSSKNFQSCIQEHLTRSESMPSQRGNQLQAGVMFRRK
ncbi:hypothetical protein [Burkholderia pyrrocinia]|uniref:hypothetical protein n=1 Tax=Burkholderia pyrrocinia TaxID=60550 RepID=UPI001BD03157|nr:hypothetical protein [Burkholderia pyrrocinia]QVN21892.1 hypothetical protein JYG32_21175 [Burkholderia pyrrocinia]